MPVPTKSNAAMSPGDGLAQPAIPTTELQKLQLKAGEITDEVSILFNFCFAISLFFNIIADYNMYLNICTFLKLLFIILAT